MVVTLLAAGAAVFGVFRTLKPPRDDDKFVVSAETEEIVPQTAHLNLFEPSGRANKVEHPLHLTRICTQVWGYHEYETAFLCERQNGFFTFRSAIVDKSGSKYEVTAQEIDSGHFNQTALQRGLCNLLTTKI